MKTFLAICLLAAILAGCTTPSPSSSTGGAVSAPQAAAAAASGNTRSVKSEDGKATLNYPESWQLVRMGNPLVVGDAPLAEGKSVPAAAGKAHYAALVTSPSDPEVRPTRTQLVDMARSDLQSMCTGDQLKNPVQDIQVDGQPGVWMYCYGQIEGRPVHASIAYAERPGRMAGVFTIAFDDAPWTQLRPMYEKIIGDLKF